MNFVYALTHSHSGVVEIRRAPSVKSESEEQIFHRTLRANCSSRPQGAEPARETPTSKQNKTKTNCFSKNVTWWWTPLHTELFLQMSRRDNFAARTCPPLLPSSIGDDISEAVLGNGKTYVTLP